MKHPYLLPLALLLTSCATRSKADLALSKGMDALDKGQAREAVVFFDEGLQKAPGDQRLLYDKILALSANGDYDQALELCDQGYALHPENLRFLTAKPTLYKLKGEPVKAIEAMDAVLRLNPALVSLRVEVMEYALQEGYAEEARFHARFLIEHHQETSRAWKALAQLDGPESRSAAIAAYLAAHPVTD